jgi:uncharacterized protein
MSEAAVAGDFWTERRSVNAYQAIFHQWEQLEASGCFENFRIAAGETDGFRKGLYFADSDAYKWLDAASRIWAATRDPKLAARMDDLIALIGRAQQPDGYLFTYNQVHFPGTRWRNLQAEHELYCHGHLIEAGVSHFQATGRADLFEIARRAADRVVADFAGKDPMYTPGHEEIEIALLRLYEVTDHTSYLDLARQLIEQRGRTSRFGWLVLRQWVDMLLRMGAVQKQAKAYAAAHPEYHPLPMMPDNHARAPIDAGLRWVSSILSGRYNQQHLPVRQQTVPVGHSVRFGYFETAVAMLGRLGGKPSYLPTLRQAWERMIERRMYVTGGLGSVPLLEGFGSDYELDPEFAYAETCAALACMFWNWEMAQLTGEAKYSDLFEWQLYNAAGVGMGLDGDDYFYNNPLACRGDVTRKPWYLVPCCPSNISRTWADLSRYTVSACPGELAVHQYTGGQRSITLPGEDGCAATLRLAMQSDFPWAGRARIEIREISSSGSNTHASFVLKLRRPSWAEALHVTVNGRPGADLYAGPNLAEPTASGYDPRLAEFCRLAHPWTAGDRIEIEVDMPVCLRQAHPKVRGHAGRVTVTRGPLVYCLESADNPGVDIFTAQLDPASLTPAWDGSRLGGCTCIHAKTTDGQPLLFIPYFLWGNRGPSQMTVWVSV